MLIEQPPWYSDKNMDLAKRLKRTQERIDEVNKKDMSSDYNFYRDEKPTFIAKQVIKSAWLAFSFSLAQTILQRVLLLKSR